MDAQTTPEEVAALWPTSWKPDESPPVAIARVKGGTEGRAEDYLASQGIPAVSMRYQFTRIYTRKSTGGRVKDTVLRPMFTGFVFFGGGPDGRDAFSDYRKRFRQIVYTRQDVSHSQQNQLKAELMVLARSANLGVLCGQAIELKVGSRVRVVCPHPLAGIEGFISEIAGHDRFVVPIATLGRFVPTTIDAKDLELYE